MYYDNMKSFGECVKLVLGKTIREIDGAEKDSGEIDIIFEDGSLLRFAHDQDCCETVLVEDVIGDVSDFAGQPLTLLEEREGSAPAGFDCDAHECCEWTFYELNCPNGSLTVRWLGESNGYYSTSVSTWYMPAEDLQKPFRDKFASILPKEAPKPVTAEALSEKMKNAWDSADDRKEYWI